MESLTQSHTARKRQGQDSKSGCPKHALAGGQGWASRWSALWEGSRGPGRGRARRAPTCQAERAEDKLGAVQDGEAAFFLLADRFRALEILGALPRPDLLYLHDVH